MLACALLAFTSSTTLAGENVRLYVFDCGLLGAADISMFNLSNDETPVRELFVPCYLIEHPEGRMIWDAGLPLAMAGAGLTFLITVSTICTSEAMTTMKEMSRR